jgi:hypothetical protein
MYGFFLLEYSADVEKDKFPHILYVVVITLHGKSLPYNRPPRA